MKRSTGTDKERDRKKGRRWVESKGTDRGRDKGMGRKGAGASIGPKVAAREEGRSQGSEKGH
jgi:hypothetical protein